MLCALLRETLGSVRRLCLAHHGSSDAAARLAALGVSTRGSPSVPLDRRRCSANSSRRGKTHRGNGRGEGRGRRDVPERREGRGHPRRPGELLGRGEGLVGPGLGHGHGGGE